MAVTKRSARARKSASPRSADRDGPPATLVLFVRHGRTPTTGKVLPGRAPGLHLAGEGVAQAETVAEQIGRLHAARLEAATKSRSRQAGSRQSGDRAPGGVTAVYASPLERTRETAAPIARALGLRTRVRSGLLECEFGDWTGRELSALAKLPEWRTVQRHPSGFRFPRGESFAEMQARMVGAVNDLVAEHPGQAIVVVSHADPIKAALASSLGTPLDLFQRIVVGPCSVSAVIHSGSGPTVLAVNHTRDLTSLAVS